MESNEVAHARSISPIMATSVFLAVSALVEFSLFYLTGFRMFTLPILGLTNLAAGLGLWRMRSWGLQLSLALFIPHAVQAIVLAGSLVRMWSIGLSTLQMLLLFAAFGYLVALTVLMLLLWRNKQTSAQKVGPTR